MLKELQGKTALVTGASRGIGAASAITLAKNGAARVVVHYGAYRQGAEQTAAAVREAGAQVDLLGADLSHPEGIAAFVGSLRKTAPEVDILVNNAGALVKRAKLQESTPELFDEIYNLN